MPVHLTYNIKRLHQMVVPTSGGNYLCNTSQEMQTKWLWLLLHSVLSGRANAVLIFRVVLILFLYNCSLHLSITKCLFNSRTQFRAVLAFILHGVFVSWKQELFPASFFFRLMVSLKLLPFWLHAAYSCEVILYKFTTVVVLSCFCFKKLIWLRAATIESLRLEASKHGQL